jgi:signal transduction histidine kinase
MMVIIKCALIIFFFYPSIACQTIDTIYIKDLERELSITDYIYFYEDPDSRIGIEDIIKINGEIGFNKIPGNNLNFGYIKSTYWLTFTVRNQLSYPVQYVIQIANPDLDHVRFYELVNNELTRTIETGELYDISTRDIYDRNFLFKVNIEPGKVYTYYISVNNNGHALFIPVSLIEKNYFEIKNYKNEIASWFIYGLFLFIFIFSIYLFRTSKDFLNLYYAFFVLFTAIFFIYYDGYVSYLNPPEWVSNTKFLFPGLLTVFLLSFTQVFVKSYNKFKGFVKLANPLKIVALVSVTFYFFKYPVFLITDVGVPLIVLLSLIVIIILSILTLRRKYSPSVLFLTGFCFSFFGLAIHILKEITVLPYTFFTEIAMKLGFIIQCILLTIAVLERFRIQQENSKKTIQESYEKIQDQKNELIKVNTELEKLSVVASETENSVAIYDINGNMEWCNAGFERLYDVTFEELAKNKRHNIRDIINHDNLETLVNFSIENKQAVFFENMIQTSKKKQVWLQTTITPYISKESNLTKLIAIDSDISELKLYERNLTIAKEKAEESDRLKTSFLANMSHEIRTPLNGIMGFGDLLKRSDLSKEKKNRYLNIIDRNGQQLLRLIDDILDISLIESNQLKMNITEFDINSVMDDMLDYFSLYKKEIQKDNVELKLIKHFKENSYLIKSDPDRLKQVLSNLINNAFKFTEKGKVSFGYSFEDSYLKFFVEDSGPGVSKTSTESLFKRFRQGEESLKRKYGGAGLGLSISKGIIEILGGKIWHDESYKEGARFYFTLSATRSNSRNKNSASKV